MLMHHVSIGVRDVPKAVAFYDKVMGALGFKRVMEFMPYAAAYGEALPEFWVGLPHDQKPASAGNGAHFCFNAKSETAVQAFHAAALASGGTDDGAPGLRPDYAPNYYGAFVRDLDGNKIEAVFFVPSAKAKAKPKAAAKKRPATKAKPKARKRK